MEGGRVNIVFIPKYRPLPRGPFEGGRGGGAIESLKVKYVTGKEKGKKDE